MAPTRTGDTEVPLIVTICHGKTVVPPIASPVAAAISTSPPTISVGGALGKAQVGVPMTRPEGANKIGVSGNVIAGPLTFKVWPPASKPLLGSAVRVLEPTANIEGAAVEEAPNIMVEEPTTILEAPGPREIGFPATMIGHR